MRPFEIAFEIGAWHRGQIEREFSRAPADALDRRGPRAGPTIRLIPHVNAAKSGRVGIRGASYAATSRGRAVGDFNSALRARKARS